MAALYQGPNAVRLLNKKEAKFVTTRRDVDSIYSDPTAGRKKDSRAYGKNLVFSETTVWL